MRTGPPSTARAVAAMATAAALIGVATALASAPASAGVTTRVVVLACRSPQVGAHPVAAEVSIDLPASGSVGRAVRISRFALTARLPQPVAAALLADGRDTVTGTGSAALSGGDAATASALTVPATTVPATGELILAATGADAAITATKPGDLVLALREVTFVLTTGSTDTDGPPGALELTCAPDPGGAAPLATIPITGTSFTKIPRPTTTTPTTTVPPSTTLPPPEETAEVPGLSPFALTPIDFKIVGKSTMAKLKSDLAMGPGEMRTLLDAKTGDLTGDLILPPSAGYFVMFGFAPATSTVEFIQAEKTVGKIFRGVLNTTSKVNIKLRDVRVAGVPLDVGPNCRTVSPAVIELTSGPSPPPFVPPRLLKPLYGTFTMPEFTGCGAKEPLDSLLSGLISGPGNAIRVELTHIPR